MSQEVVEYTSNGCLERPSMVLDRHLGLLRNVYDINSPVRLRRAFNRLRADRVTLE